MKFNHCRGP